MNLIRDDRGDFTFTLGMLAGTVVGAGLTLWLAPRASSEMRQRLTASAESLGQRASERYRQASTQLATVVEDIGTRGQGARNGLADAVAHGAQEVERIALSAKTDRQAMKA
jgi:gas vesicle protein